MNKTFKFFLFSFGFHKLTKGNNNNNQLFVNCNIIFNCESVNFVFEQKRRFHFFFRL